MSIKASLRIQLLANDVVVAESDDELLWQRTLAAIATGNLPPGAASGFAAPASLTGNQKGPGNLPDAGLDEKRRAFAQELGVSEEAVVAACNPTIVAPYVELDGRYWEMFKRNTPKRGPGSVASIQLACTLLALWAKHGGFGPPTVTDGLGVLATIHVHDPNGFRGVANCSWLQKRAGGVVINPTEFSKAAAVARSYCLKQPASSTPGEV